MACNRRVMLVGPLKEAIVHMLRAWGMGAQHAKYVADTLVTASLWGIDTHGVELLSTYLKEVAGGRSCVRPQMAWVVRRAGMALLDANGSLGVVAGNIAVRKAIEIATRNGISAVGVRNSNHFGPAGYYGYLAAEAGMIGFAFTNADALVAALDSDIPLSGTNPISVVAPTANQPFILDMATSQTSFSKVKELTDSGCAVPSDWIMDSGRVGTYPVLKPLGGYKGQGLGLAVQILCCVLTGSPFDIELGHLFFEPYSDCRKIGHFFMCVDINSFLPLTEFSNRLSELLKLFRSTRTVTQNNVIVPGDKESAMRVVREVHGIPISENLWEILKSFARSQHNASDRTLG